MLTLPVMRLGPGLYEAWPVDAEECRGQMVGALLEVDDQWQAFKYNRRPESFLGTFATIDAAVAAFYERRVAKSAESQIKRRTKQHFHKAFYLGGTRWCECGANKFTFGRTRVLSRYPCASCGSFDGVVQQYQWADDADRPRVWLHQECIDEYGA